MQPNILHLLVQAVRGGCERACEQLCRYWPEARHRVLVLGELGEMSAVWERMGVPVDHLNVMNLPRRVRARALTAATAHMPATNGTMVWHGMAELPVILHALPADRGPVFVHGGNPATSLTAWTDWRYLLAERLRFPRRHDPLYIACSQYVADSFEGSRYLRRFRRHVVTNGVEPLPADAVHVPRSLIPQADAVVIGMLARLDAIKDHAGLLRAFALVRQRMPHARLELAGDGDQRTALEQLAADLGVAGAVAFLGTVRNVYELLPRWDLFAYATTTDEGFGIALAEALMCGLPAVVTDVGPVREVCGDPDEAAAVYVPPRDPAALAAALTELIADLPRRQALATAARGRAVTKLSAKVFARRYERVMDEECRRTDRRLPPDSVSDSPSSESPVTATSAPRSWIACQLGAREHYAVPKALHLTGKLDLLVTDLWSRDVRPRRWLRRLGNRFEAELRGVPTVAFPAAFLPVTALKRVGSASPRWRSVTTQLADEIFQRLAARCLRRFESDGKGSPKVVFAYSYSARRPFQVAKSRAWLTVLGQINPGPREEEIVCELYREEFGRAVSLPATAPGYWRKWREECALADAVVVNSSWSRQLAAATGVDPAKLHVVPLAYERPPGSAGFAREYPERFTAERPLRVLYLGAVHLRKGVHLLLRAAKALAEEEAAVEFRVVGRDEWPGGLPSPLPGNVRRVAEVDRRETAAFYREADVFVLPTFSDGFALTLLEAQAWNLPAIVTTRCGEVITHRRNGLVMDEVSEACLKQAILECLSSPALLRDFAAHSVDFAAYSLATIGRQLQELAAIQPR